METVLPCLVEYQRIPVLGLIEGKEPCNLSHPKIFAGEHVGSLSGKQELASGLSL
jgi:hypothetical protein